MFFKNLTVFTFSAPFTLSDTDLNEKLLEKAYRPCSKIEPMIAGWVSPIAKNDTVLTHPLQGYTLLCLKIQEKVIPGAVVNEALAERIAAIEKEQGRTVSKKDKETLKEDVYADLLPQAFAKSKKIFCYIDSKNGRFIIDTASGNTAEFVVTTLRKTLGSFKVEHAAVSAPGMVMSQWLKTGQYPAELTLLDTCTLKAENGDETATVKCQGHDLLSQDVRAFIQPGVAVTELALSWQDALLFKLTDEFSIKSLKFSDGIKSLNSDVVGDTTVQFDANFILMAETFSDFITSLLTMFQSASTKEPAQQAA